jgi:hypothetical protein
MTITMHGGLYFSMAYSKERGNTLSTPAGDLCQKLMDEANDFNDNEFDRKANSLKTKIDAAKAKKKCEESTSPEAKPGDKAGAGASQKRCQNDPGDAIASLWYHIVESGIFDQTFGLREQFQQAIAPYVDTGRRNDEEGVFAGYAVIYMGETSISSLKHPLKVESTGQCVALRRAVVWRCPYTQACPSYM